MAKFKKFASDHPIRFSIVITIIFLLVTVLAGVFSYPVNRENEKQLIMGTIRIVGLLFFLYLLWRFDWLNRAGITNLGSQRIWILVFPAIFYTLLVYTYGFFGKLTFTIDNPTVAASVMFNMLAGGGLQEIVFRGVILYTLVRIWGNNRYGLSKSVWVSALFFSALHLFNLLNIVIASFSNLAYDTQVLATVMQVITTFISGCVYAAIVLYGGSIWPVVLYHGLLNAMINVLWLTTPDAVETMNSWLFILVMKVPLVIYGYILMQRVKSVSGATATQVA